MIVKDGLALMTVVALGSGARLTAHAGSLSKTVSGSNGSKLQYGYNTFLINEDKAYAIIHRRAIMLKLKMEKGLILLGLLLAVNGQSLKWFILDKR